MYAGEQLKYGHINGGTAAVQVAMAASQVVSANSGRFVYLDAGAATINVDGSLTIYGHLETHAHTPTVGDKIKCIVDLSAIYRIPVNSGTYVVAMQGDQCDISVLTYIQGAQLDASMENTLTVVDGDTVNNKWVDVMMTPSNWGTGAGVEV